MVSNSLLLFTSISQWILFVGIAFILFGWIEKREHFVLAGQLLFLLLGFFSFWVLLGVNIHIPKVTGNEVPKEMKVLAYFKSTLLFVGLDAISLLLELFKVRYRKYSVYMVVFFALLLFFMVFSIQQLAK